MIPRLAAFLALLAVLTACDASTPAEDPSATADGRFATCPASAPECDAFYDSDPARFCQRFPQDPRCDPRGGGDAPFEATPLTELTGGQTYQGLDGLLYDGSNDAPASHVAAGMDALARVEPLDQQGHPSANGDIVFLAIGMSNVTQEFCNPAGAAQPRFSCNPWTFMGQALGDPAVDRTNLVLVNGATPGLAGESWDDAVRDGQGAYRNAQGALSEAGVTEAQVQVVWTKVALTRESSRPSLPSPDADAYYEAEVYGDVVRALKARYPNLRMVFLSPRIYGGWADPNTNTPEPWAYETGFAVKWLVDAQVTQRETGAVSPLTGDLLPDEVFVDWGPYMWASGLAPRQADGLTWPRSDFQDDGMHPERGAEEKVGRFLLDFMKTSPYTCWFTAAGC